LTLYHIFMSLSRDLKIFLQVFFLWIKVCLFCTFYQNICCYFVILVIEFRIEM
jgi:hypothetical protein